MADDLRGQVILRNARFRAWRAYGVPIAGGWALIEAGRIVGLKLICTACKHETMGMWGASFFTGLDLVRQERYEVGHHRRQTGCSHLDALGGDDPPEIVQLTDLEVLQGDLKP